MFSNIRNYLNNDDYNINITNNLLYITNYQKINMIKNDKISISFKEFNLLVEGDDLIISKLLDTEILFNGVVRKVSFEFK